MTTINHHLTDPLLMSYAAGTLPEAFSLVVATHVSMCEDCRARLEAFEAVGGALLNDDVATVPMGSDALEATMALIEDRSKRQIHVPDHVACKVLPTPLHDYVGGGLDAVTWKPLGGGVKHAVLDTSRDATVRLLSIPAGAAMPDHGHRGMELTLVLQGAFSDDDGRYARGDIEVANEEMHHTPVAEPGENCICLAATDAPLRFRGILPRLAQPFIGI